MTRRNLLKATILTTVIATLLVSSACGKKTANDNTNIATTQSMQTTTAVSKETEKSNNNNTNTESVSETNSENESLETENKDKEENAELVVSENNNNIASNISEEQEIIVADNNIVNNDTDNDNNNNNNAGNNEVVANNTPNVDVVDNTPAPTPAKDNNANEVPVVPAEPATEAPVVSTTPYEYDPYDGSSYKEQSSYNDIWKVWRRQFIGIGGGKITPDDAYAKMANICKRYAAGSISKEQAEAELWTCTADTYTINGTEVTSFTLDGKYQINGFWDAQELSYAISDGIDGGGQNNYTILYYSPADDKTIVYYIGVSVTDYK